MYKNKTEDGRCNICGVKIKQIREKMPGKVSQRAFADRVNRFGVVIDKNAIQRIESGQRFVTDIELKAIAAALDVSYEVLLED
ncbi:MAG: helix-turn-helix transcriptional regulator [Clostridiales bacterium]|nr:helix-turn-helix transcriptional regulator [Clostridiales bacterium]